MFAFRFIETLDKLNICVSINLYYTRFKSDNFKILARTMHFMPADNQRDQKESIF